MGIEEGTVIKAGEVLQKLTQQSPSGEITKRVAIQKLKKSIVAARAAGRTWAEIISSLKEVGLSVTEEHVRACISTKQKQTQDKKTKSDAVQGKDKKETTAKVAEILTTLAAVSMQNTGISSGSGRSKVRPDTPNL